VPTHPLAYQQSTAFDGDPGSYDLEAHAAQLTRRLGMAAEASQPMRPTATPLLMAGVGQRTAAFVRKLVEPLGMDALQAGGAATAITPDTPQHFVAGGAIGVQFVTGDVSMTGIGTVTHVEGTRLCGF